MFQSFANLLHGGGYEQRFARVFVTQEVLQHPSLLLLALHEERGEAVADAAGGVDGAEQAGDGREVLDTEMFIIFMGSYAV